MLPALACGKGDLPESVIVQAYHPRMGKTMQETVCLDSLGERPPSVEAFDDFLQHTPDLEAKALERCIKLQRLLRNCDDVVSERKRTHTGHSDSTVPGSWCSSTGGCRP